MRKKRVISIICTAAMGFSMLAGCGQENNDGNKPSSGSGSAQQESTSSQESKPSDSSAGQGQDSASTSYPVEGGKSFTYGLTLDSAWSDRFDSFDELPLGKALEEQTGYDMKMVHVADKSAMNLLLASGDLPDAITYNFAYNYTGGNEKAYKDGLSFPMTEEFLKQNAPDYYAYLTANPEVMKQVKTTSQDVFGFGFILGGELLKGGFGLIVRDDWCKDLNLELPKTPDEYVAMLKAFKEKKDASIPLCATVSTIKSMMVNGTITSPFGLVSMDPYLNNNTVEIGYAQKEFKDVLAWLHTLYQEGLLDPNFATLDQETVSANMLTNKSGASAGACGSVLGTWLTTNKNVAGYSLAGIKNLVAKDGDTPLYGQYNNDVPGNMTIITASCKNPEEVAKFFNFGYTEAGNLLYNFGIEGKSFEYVSDKPIFTDLVLNNPNGLTIKQALSEYQRAWTNGPFVQNPDYLLQYYADDRQKEALIRWCDNDAKKYKFPNTTIPQESASDYSSLVSEIQTYRDEMIIKFIRGEESFDKFDSYLQTLDSMGLPKLKTILQTSLEDYNRK